MKTYSIQLDLQVLNFEIKMNYSGMSKTILKSDKNYKRNTQLF